MLKKSNYKYLRPKDLKNDFNKYFFIKKNNLFISIKKKLFLIDKNILSGNQNFLCEKLALELSNSNYLDFKKDFFFLSKIYPQSDIELFEKKVSSFFFHLLILSVEISKKFKNYGKFFLILDNKDTSYLTIINSKLHAYEYLKIITRKHFFYTFLGYSISFSILLLSIINLFIPKLKNFYYKDQDLKFLYEIFNTDYGFNENINQISSNWFEIREKSNIIFFSERSLSKNYLSRLKYNDIKFLDLSLKKIIFVISFKKKFKFFKLVFFNFFLLVKDILKFNNFFRIDYLKAILTFYRWNYLFKNHQLINYVACYQGLQAHYIFRNSILHSKNIKTIRYEHTINNNWFQFSNDILPIMINTFTNYSTEYHIGYMNYKTYFNNNFSKTKSHKIINFPFINLSDIGVVEKNLHFKDNFLYISAFPSSYNPNSSNSILELVFFIRNLFRLLNKNKKIVIMYKDKTSSENFFSHDYLNRLFKKKLSYYSNRFKIVNIFPNLLISKSDLVISMAFSSTFLESLFMEKKSLVYDHNRRWSNSPYYNYQKLISTNYNELSSNVVYWSSRKYCYYSKKIYNPISKLIFNDKEYTLNLKQELNKLI